MIGKALVVWVLIAGLEVVQGILRIRFLNRRLGDRRARQVGVLAGSLMILAVTWATAGWVGAETAWQEFWVGLLWLALMLAFDLAVGRRVFRMSWARIGRDFDLRRGGTLGLGMLVLLFAPLLVGALGRLG